MHDKHFLWIFFFFVLGSVLPVVAAEKSVEKTVQSVQQEVPQAKEYDGLWFCGFNFNKDLFGGERGRLVRQAFNEAIPRATLCQQLIGDSEIPSGVIPPTMGGYDAALQGYAYDVSHAKTLMRKAEYRVNDKVLKHIVLLHTDGEKTIQIAKAMEKSLKVLGVKLIRKQIPYSDSGTWEKELAAKRFHLYLMGYKAEDPGNALSLLKPLFSSEGEANVGGYRQDKVDFLIFQIEKTADSIQKTEKLTELNRLLVKDAATINFFYITKLPDLPKELTEDL